MPPEPTVEALSAADLQQNLALSSSVGWPDTESEWLVIYEAALVFGVKRDGQLIAQGALGVFEGAASIAKMVVAPSAQKQGLGGRVLDALLSEAERRSLHRIGLVATQAGRRLYESRGFTPEGDVAIMVGSPKLVGERSASAPVAAVAQLLELERHFTGNSRAAVLAGRWRGASASAICAAGFALATAQSNGHRVGPIFAADQETARALTTDLLLGLAGPVRFDVPGAQGSYRAWLAGLGVVEKGIHVEMSRGGRLPWHVPTRFALATQAWG